MERAYATITVKAMDGDGDKRTFSGIATTPTADRVGDIVLPKGAKFKLPLPLLWQHNKDKPIGWIKEAKVTSKGIEIVGEVADIPEEGTLKDKITECWQQLKYGLVRGLSIGFNPLKYARIGETWSYEYQEWEWLELSAVTIPANQEASIGSIKSVDEECRAALGIRDTSVVQKLAGASASSKPLKITKGISTVKIAEQIAALEAARQAKAARMEAIMQKGAEEGRTTTAEESEEFDTLSLEVKTADADLVRLRNLEKLNAEKATPVTGQTQEQGTQSRAGVTHLQVKSNLPQGTEFARYVKCLAQARGNRSEALEIAKSQYPDNPNVIEVLKAAVAAGTTTDSVWAGALVNYQYFLGDFIDYLRPQTIIGKFGTNGIPDLFRVPFNIQVAGQTTGGSGYWVGQGAPKPLTKFNFENITLRWAKVANIAVLTEELVRFSNPSADVLVRNALAAALIERLDTDFVDPDKVAVADVSPASITNGVTQIQSSGNDADAVRADVAAVMTQFINANMTPVNGVWIMAATTALTLSLMRNAMGQKEFPDMTMMGGRFEGLPVIVSQYVANDSDGAFVILADASEIYLADDGQVTIDASREASLQMLDNPTNNSSTGTATSMVSMFQTNSIAIRAERWINWRKRRTNAVAVLAGVNWTANP